MFITFGSEISPLEICPKEIIRSINKNYILKCPLSFKTAKELENLHRTRIHVIRIHVMTHLYYDELLLCSC